LIPDKTWEQAVRECLTQEQIDYILQCDSHCFVFEYCSPYNQVVRQYNEPHLILLTVNAIHNFHFSEHDKMIVDIRAEEIGFKRPTVYNFESLEDMRNFMKWVETIQISTH
jgi:tRNA splicing ligase